MKLASITTNATKRPIPPREELTAEPLTLKESSSAPPPSLWSGGFIALIYFDIAPTIGVGPFVGRWVGALVIVCLATGAFGLLFSVFQGLWERARR